MLVERTIKYVKEELGGAEKGHDWFHVERVWKMARHLHQLEGRGDSLVIELAALLHDISDPKFNGGDEELGSQLASNFLNGESLEASRIEHIRQIIKHVGFKGGAKQETISSIEFQIVQDADRLDALGAIGIARTFHYGGYKNRAIYDPDLAPREYENTEAYRKSDAPSINHFYEKLFKLKELMNTATGKQVAEERHSFMEEFLERFFREWEGKG